MSQGTPPILDLARRFYVNVILPNLRPAVSVALSTSSVAMLSGPNGLIPGTTIGLAFPEWAVMLISAFNYVLAFCIGNPVVVAVIQFFIQKLRKFIRSGNNDVHSTCRSIHQ